MKQQQQEVRPKKTFKTTTTATVVDKVESKKRKHVEISQEEVDDTDNTANNKLIDTSVTFESLGLDATLCETCSKLGYKNPTNIQREAIPVAVEGNDIIGIAETGSGKTAAFILPILHHLIQRARNGQGNAPYSALILAPTRELAIQIHQHVNAIGSEIGVNSMLIVSGEKLNLQAAKLAQKRIHVIVGTPGRVTEHLRSTKGFKLHNTQFLVLDEADKMLGSEFETDLDLVFAACSSSTRKTFLFSATMTKKVEKLEKAQLKDPVKVQVTTNKYATVETLTQQYLFIPEKYKEIYLAYLLNENAGKRILVFSSQNVTCLTLSIMLRNLKFPCIPLSGHMSEMDRVHCLKRFVAGDRPILVATDVASRGLDIPLVDIVINYDIPVNPKEYVHRVGRTARIGNSGLAITFTTQYDVEYLQKIEELVEKKMDICETNKNDVLVLTNTVGTALELAKKKLYDIEKGLDRSGNNNTEDNNNDHNDDDQVVHTAIKTLSSKRQMDKNPKKKSSTNNTTNNNKRRKY
jgi:ATP-dependent RNA helicase DDX47/RRP3